MYYCSHHKEYEFQFELFDKPDVQDCSCSKNQTTQYQHDDVCRWKGYYPIDDCLRTYNPKDKVEDKQEEIEKEETLCKSTKHKCTKYCVHGVNILNKQDVEIHEIKAKIKTRKENHSKVEKRRRVQINSSIEEMEKLLPENYINLKAKNSKGLVLFKTLAYLKELKAENEMLKAKLK